MTLSLLRALAVSLPSILLLGGCVLSVHPVVSEAEADFDARLIGQWEEVAGSDRAVVTRGEGKAYAIEYTSEGKTGRFIGRLGKIRDHLILDVAPVRPEGKPPDPAFGLVLTGHLLLILEIDTNTAAITALDPEKPRAALRSEAIRLAYHESKDECVLEATTEQLRAGLGPYLSQPGTLPPREQWTRVRRATTKLRGPVDVPCFEAAAWREADDLFRQDPRWVGSDCAASVDLGGGRVLWLFGDTWIDPSGQGRRAGGRMISNSVAIQSGTDPTRATMKFYWGRAGDGGPAAFIPDEGKERHWFGNGVRVGDRLVLFLDRVVTTGTGIGFESVGWAAWMVENPDEEPAAWRMRRLPTPTNPLGILTGCASVRRVGDHVYAFGSEDPVKSHPLYVARWPADEVQQGRLMTPEWWAGERLGWIPESAQDARVPIFENGAPELSIHFDETSGRFLAVQTTGFGPADVMLRAAPELTGPWTPPRLVYRPPEYYKDKTMIYAAKAHPELTGADLVLTYATNNFDFSRMVADSRCYYPRFVRLTRCQ